MVFFFSCIKHKRVLWFLIPPVSPHLQQVCAALCLYGHKMALNLPEQAEEEEQLLSSCRLPSAVFNTNVRRRCCHIITQDVSVQQFLLSLVPQGSWTVAVVGFDRCCSCFYQGAILLEVCLSFSTPVVCVCVCVVSMFKEKQ